MIKKVAYCYYVHKSNLSEMKESLSYEQNHILRNVLQNNNKNKFDIIKYNTQNNYVSLIVSEDWDTANEPTVGNSHCYKIDGTVKKTKGGSKVYHNKWQFVSVDYDGFDIGEAKVRTETWNKIDGIKSLKKKIGSKRIWYKILKENNLEI